MGGRVEYKAEVIKDFPEHTYIWAYNCLENLKRKCVDIDTNLVILHKKGDVWRLNIGGVDCGFLDDLEVWEKIGTSTLPSNREPMKNISKCSKDYEFKGLINDILEINRDIKLIVIPSCQMVKTRVSGKLFAFENTGDIQKFVSIKL